jgi:maltose-binding protein MalE
MVIVNLVVLVSFSLTACGFATMVSPEATKTISPVTITLWYGADEASYGKMTQVISTFEALNPTITVEGYPIPHSQLLSQYFSAASQRTGPDLLLGPMEWIGTLAQANLISALDSYTLKIGLDRLNPSAVRTNSYLGLVYAFPISLEEVALWYNTSIVKTAPTTSEDLLRLAESYGLALTSNFYETAGFLFSNDGQILDSKGKCVLDQGTGFEQGLSWLVNAEKTGGVVVNSDRSFIDSKFMGGEVGMIFESSQMGADFEAALGLENLAVADPISFSPAGKLFAPFLVTDNFFLNINSTGEKKAAALLFLNFMSLPDTQALFVSNYRIPSNPNTDGNTMIKVLIRQSLSVTLLPNEPEMGAVWDPANTLINSILSSGMDIDLAITSTVDEINSTNHR